LNKQKQNGNHQRRSNVEKFLASRERLRFKEVIVWISKQSVWTDTNGVHCLETCVFSVSSKR